MAFAEMDTLFDDIIDFLASTPTPQQIIDFAPSQLLQERLSELLEKNRSGQLSKDEKNELDEFLRMNRFMSRLKLKARDNLDA